MTQRDSLIMALICGAAIVFSAILGGLAGYQSGYENGERDSATEIRFGLLPCFSEE